MFEYLIGLAITAVIAVLSFGKARDFVRTRLRYVDAALSPLAPVAAGLGALLVALPVVALLPIVGAGTAITFGIAVGAGVAAGAREVRRALPPGSTEV